MMCYGTSKRDLPVTRLNKVSGYRRSNLGQVSYRWTKRIKYVVITVQLIKIFVEYVEANMGIQVPLLVIDQRGVSVMST